MNVKRGTFFAVLSIGHDPGPLSAALRLSPPCASHCTSCTDCHPPHKTSNLLPRSESSSIPSFLLYLHLFPIEILLVFRRKHIRIFRIRSNFEILYNTKIKTVYNNLLGFFGKRSFLFTCDYDNQN